jgi:hypothetical protein
MSNVLDPVDETIFRFEEATGVTSMGQCVWVYNRAIDMDGLRRFHGHLQRGRLSRRIERSPLPFGRRRWVSPRDEPELEIATPRPREQFEAWLAEQAAIPLNAEHGPGWHLAVLPFTDGGAGVSLVALHSLADGMAGCLAVVEAACGYDSAIAWPAAGSRRRWQALREDAHQAARDLPGIGRALLAAARLARSDHDGAVQAAPRPAPPTGPDESIALPTETIFVDADEWDARAEALGGTSNSLLAGLAARLARRVGRVTVDGSVTLGIPVNERTAGDTRANAVANVDITVDPARAATDLRAIRAATKQALIRRGDATDNRRELLPLVPLMPQRLVRRIVGVAAGSPTAVVSSNIGVVDPDAYRPDGTPAEQFAIKAPHPDVSTSIMDRFGGMLSVASGRANGEVFVSVVGYQPGLPHSNEALRHALSGALSDLSLTARVGWPCREPARAAG